MSESIDHIIGQLVKDLAKSHLNHLAGKFKFQFELNFAGIFVSNCGAALRNKWLEGIMDRVKVKSYGRCWHTDGATCERGSGVRVAR